MSLNKLTNSEGALVNGKAFLFSEKLILFLVKSTKFEDKSGSVIWASGMLSFVITKPVEILRRFSGMGFNKERPSILEMGLSNSSKSRMVVKNIRLCNWFVLFS